MAAQPEGSAAGVVARYEALLEKYHELVKELTLMKREGFTAMPTSEAPVRAPELPDEVMEAIREVATPGDLTWRHLTKQAWELLREDEPAEVAARIRAGEPAPL